MSLKPCFLACVDRKRGDDSVPFEGYTPFTSPRRVIHQGKSILREDGGVTLYAHRSVSDFFVRDHTSNAYPEVAAVEYKGELFNVSSNVVVVTVYISCSNLDAATEYIESYRVSQLVALTEILRTFRMAELNILLFGDMNAYTLSLYGFFGESEFDNALP